MDKRQRRQIIIGGVYASIFLAIVIGIVLSLLPEPSPCLDKVRQCDGPNPPCLPCEFYDLKPFEIIWIKAFPVAAGAYDLAAQIKNPNLSWGAESFGYKFEVFDANGGSLGTRVGQSFILPAVDSFLIENRFLSDQPIGKLSLTFSPMEEIGWKKLKNLGDFQLSARETNFRLLGPSESGYAELTGTAFNETSFSFQRLRIKAAVFDADKQPLAVSSTVLDTVKAGERRFFKMTWPYAFAGEMRDRIVLVETNVFSDENFLRKYGE